MPSALKRKCLENTGIPFSVSDKNFEEVMWKMITKATVDINANDIEDCHLVWNKGQNIIKFGKKKVLSQVLSVRKDLIKTRMSDIDLTEQNALYINQSLCPYYRMLWSKTETYQIGKTDSFYVSNGNIKIRMQENARLVTIFHTHNFVTYFHNVSVVI